MKYLLIASVMLVGACSNFEGDTSSYPVDNDQARHERWRDFHSKNAQ